MFVANTNKHDIDIFINDTFLKKREQQGDLDFVFDQRESEVKLHKMTSSTESPSNVSPGAVGDQSIGNPTGYRTIDQY